MRRGHGQVDDEVDVVSGEDFVHSQCFGNSELCGAGARQLHVEIAERDIVDLREVVFGFQVERADVAAADYTDIEGHLGSPVSRVERDDVGSGDGEVWTHLHEVEPPDDSCINLVH
jgi:hypothetical protein